MFSLQSLQTIILLLVVVVALQSVAIRVRLPYPILVVVGGLVLGFTPVRSTIRLAPELVLLVFLPPILWATAYFRSLEDFRANARTIALLAVGLVVITSAIVAAVAHAIIPELPWAAAILLGAIVAPPDEVAATSMPRDVAIPRRVVTLLEGESLFNDAVALVLYRAALDAVVGGTFHPAHAVGLFVSTGVVGVASGLVVSRLMRWWLRYAGSAVGAVAITIVAPYAAWTAAELAHGSPVLACVVGGFYTREQLRRVASPETRVQAQAVWELLVFVLHGLIFMLIGLEIGSLYDALSDVRAEHFLWEAVIVCAAVIAARLIIIPLGVIVPQITKWWTKASRLAPNWPHLLLLSWAGMRGIVSLAAALAIPTTVRSGAPFPFRTEIILLTFAVILVTLVLQGLSFAPLARSLGVDESAQRQRELAQERLAREHATTTALEWLDAVAEDLALDGEGKQGAETGSAAARTNARAAYGPVAPGSEVLIELEYLRSLYAARLKRLALHRARTEGKHESPSDDASVAPLHVASGGATRRLHHDVLAVQRAAIAQLHRDGRISDEVAQRLEHELDLDAVRLES